MVNLSPPAISLLSPRTEPHDGHHPGPHAHADSPFNKLSSLSARLIPIPKLSSSASPDAVPTDYLHPLLEHAQHAYSPLQLLLVDSQVGSFAAHSAGIDIPHQPLLMLNAAGPGSATGRRVRSGSLFLTNSIWNDEALLMHSPLRALTNSVLDIFPENSLSGSNPGLVFLSPSLGAQASLLGIANPTRNRSHTTSGPVHLGGMHALDPARMAASPFLSAVPHDTSALFDNLMLNIPELPGLGRNRSQTYSGATPTIPEVPMAGNPMGVLNYPSQPLNQRMFELQGQHIPEATPFAQMSQPFLQDDSNFTDLTITTNFENPSLGPTNTLLLDNVPQFVDAANLYQLLNSPTGMVSTGYHLRGILSVRVSNTSTSKLALVVCPSVEVAMNIKATFNHLEIVPGIILYVAFAKLSEEPAKLPRSPALVAQKSSSHDSGRLSNESSNGSLNANTEKLDPPEITLQGISESLVNVVSRMAGNIPLDLRKVRSLISQATSFPKSSYQKSYGPLPEPIAVRQFDSPKLRELRKLLENNERALLGQQPQADEAGGSNKVMSQMELEDLALAMLDELPELSYDHIGNTIVQKLFTVIESPLIKLMMVKELAPYLTQLGIHKNGTWAIQKIINLCHEDYQQKVLIANSLKPFSVKLFNDQFGNYVLQCCLKFGSPFNDFIFETVLDNFLEISSGRFGARCIRTILETANDQKSAGTSAVSNEQLYLVASLIVEFANNLVTNNNGSLLITWFLDTFNGRGASYDARYELLCDKFMPHLAKLCTHKLANLTIFKLLNNRSDYMVKQRLMDAIFGSFNEYADHDGLRPSSKLLETILAENQEQNAGPLFVYKILSNPSLLSMGDEHMTQMYQQFVLNQVKRVLLEMNIVNVQPYKKLIDEVGLSGNRLNRSSSMGRKSKRGSGSGRNGSKAHAAGHHQQMDGGMMPQQMSFNAPMGNYGIYQNAAGMEGARDVEYGGYAPMNAMPMQPNQFHQDMAVMQQLEQLSLSSAAMGYGLNPGTPGQGNGAQRSMFF